MTAQAERTAYVWQLAEYLGLRYGVMAEAITERRGRLYLVALARHLICYRLYSMHWTTLEIAELMHLDHSSVSHAVKRIHALVRVDAEVAADYAGMPAWGEHVFTDASLVAMYERLTKALDEASYWKDRIEASLASQNVPTRLRAVK